MSVFSESIDFLVKLGIYDVVLPFMLVFTIVFAILEKTKILGVEKSGDKEYTKKNLNAMVAFVIGFLVVASAQLVSIINRSVSKIFLILLLIICFLMLAGAFHKQEKDGFFLDPKKHKFYYNAMMVLVFAGIMLIFLYEIGWLDSVYNFLKNNWNASYVAAVIFVLATAGFIAWVTKDQAPEKKDEKESS